MKIAQRQKDKVEYFELTGDLDFGTSPELREKLHQVFSRPSSKVIINLKNVPYIDSSGLATFVDALKKSKQSGGSLVLTDLTPAVLSVFEIAKLDKIFTITASEAEAERVFSS